MALPSCSFESWDKNPGETRMREERTAILLTEVPEITSVECEESLQRFPDTQVGGPVSDSSFRSRS